MKFFNKSNLPGLKQGVELAPYTTWKIGGPAEYFWEPERELLPDAVAYCTENDIPAWYLGRGSNVLIDSNGLDGLTICTRQALSGISCKDGIITAEAGVPMPTLSKYAAKLGYGGYEYFIGIPGTIGAGIAINAGLSAKGRKEIGDVLIDVELMDKWGNVFTETKELLKLGYRRSNIHERELFVLSARFKPTYMATKEEIVGATVNHLAERRRKQPLSKPTAGSTFKQPPDGKPAGWYIDQAGLKGLQIGGAKVSEKHANWIENTGDASSGDVEALIKKIQEKVLYKFQIKLEPEIVHLRNSLRKTGYVV